MKSRLPEIRGDILRIPEEKLLSDLRQQHAYTLYFSAGQFLVLTKSWQSSATATLAAIISDTLAGLYDAGDRDVVLKVTADMRPYFGTKTRVNFSEAVVLASSRELRDRSPAEHSRELRTMMKRQLTADNFKKYLAAGIANSRRLSGEIDEPDVKVATPPLTYVLTYPGRMDLPEEYDAVVEDFELKGYFPVDTIRFSVKTTKDTLSLGIAQTFDTDRIIRAIAQSFEKLGFETRIEDDGRIEGDNYDTARIRVAEE